MTVIYMTRGHYNSIATFYDFLDSPFEYLIYSKMRRKYLSDIRDSKILEIGVGTGKNLLYYDPSNSIIAVDQSLNMLKMASNRVESLNDHIKLRYSPSPPYDIQNNSIDFVITTFVLYTSDKAQSLVDEARRVLKSEGKLILFEYRFPNNKLLQWLTYAVTPLTSYLFGVDFRFIDTPHLFKENWDLIHYNEIIPQLIYVAMLTPNI